MRRFTDNAGREWKIDVNGNSLGKVLDDTGIDLTKLIDKEDQETHKQITHPVYCVRILASLCEEQMKDQNVTPQSFGEALKGDAVVNANRELVYEIADFFPESARLTIRRLIQAGEKIREQAEEILQGLQDDPILDNLVDEQVGEMKRLLAEAKNRSTSGEPSTDLAESSG